MSLNENLDARIACLVSGSLLKPALSHGKLFDLSELYILCALLHIEVVVVHGGGAWIFLINGSQFLYL